MPDPILVDRRGFIATVTLNRPEKLNALTKAMWQRLGEAFRELGRNKELRCIVLRGAGTKAFSPGNDISEFESDRSNAAQAKAYGRLMHHTIEAIRNCPIPTVAMIHGICVGGGMEIAGLCDIRIAGQSSRFGAPIKRLGLVMAYPEIESLAGLVGPSRALEILLEGQIFGADKALAWGVVSRIVPDDQVETETHATTGRIADGAPLVARWHKKFLRRLAEGRPLTEAEFDEGFACFDTEDFRIGYKSFLAKTKPDFVGR
jgi:enoyl-CoA hydratase/carnithine racemase